MNQTPIVISFAGVVGSSKTPIASFLSWKLNLPIFSHDAIRSEIQADLLRFDQQEYLQRRDLRLQSIINTRMSFMYDASVDREWQNLRSTLIEHGYHWFIISLDLTKPLLLKFYQAKNYEESRPRLDQLLQEHDQFTKNHADDIGLHIPDQLFPQRLQLSFEAVQAWLKTR